MENNYAKMEDFEFKWRFTEEEYNVLPKEDLEKIRPLSVSYSNECWDYWISDKAGHFMKLQIEDHINYLTLEDCGWGDSEKEPETLEFLNKNIAVDEDQKITFFWSRNLAVETCWSTFTRYWTDFCYPSDDSNIIVIHDNPYALVYVEDKILLVERMRFFGRY